MNRKLRQKGNGGDGLAKGGLRVFLYQSRNPKTLNSKQSLILQIQNILNLRFEKFEFVSDLKVSRLEFTHLMGNNPRQVRIELHGYVLQVLKLHDKEFLVFIIFSIFELRLNCCHIHFDLLDLKCQQATVDKLV